MPRLTDHTVGRLTRIPLRQVWEHEAYDFTTWLQQSLDVLNEVLSMNLASAEREQLAGDFSVDLLAEDEAGRPVVIENQLSKTDHDHLGKLLVYLSNLDARAAIWISPEPRPEHVKAVNWLNESDIAEFYLLKLEAICIDDSPPAPLLTEIVGPSEESREVGNVKKKFSEREHLREHFWTSFLEYANSKTTLHSSVSPSKYPWISAGAGHSGLGFNYVVGQHEVRAELYIYQPNNASENREIFDYLYEHRNQIEESYGGELHWQPLEEKKASRIHAKPVSVGYCDDEEEWRLGYQKVVDQMIRLERALRPHLDELPF